MAPGLKYWVRPDIDNRIAAGEIRALFQHAAGAHRAGPDHRARTPTGKKRNVCPPLTYFALTGYHPDFDFLTRAGIELDAATKRRA